MLHHVVLGETPSSLLGSETKYGARCVRRVSTWIYHGVAQITEMRVPSAAAGVAPAATGGAAPAAPSTGAVAKLPDLKLRIFKGDIEAWPDWWSRFNSVIEARSDLTVGDKFLYLQHYVAGSALRTIEGYSGPSQYGLAKNALRRQFDKPELLQDRLVASIGALQKATLTKASLKDLHDQLFKAAQILKQTGHTSVSLYLLLNPVVRKKLSQELLVRWCDFTNEKRSAGGTIGFDEMLEFLDNQTRVAELLDDAGKPLKTTSREKEGSKEEDSHLKSGAFLLAPGKKQTPSKKKGGKSKQRQARPTPPSTAPSTSRAPQPPQQQRAQIIWKTPCPFCQLIHRIVECTRFRSMPVRDRARKIREFNLCVNCFGKHDVNLCAKGSCLVCNKRHHSSLHVDN